MTHGAIDPGEALSFAILDFEPRQGPEWLRAVLAVAVSVAGAEVRVNGLRVYATSRGGYVVKSPRFPVGNDGGWMQAVELPASLLRAIAAEADARVGEAEAMAADARARLRAAASEDYGWTAAAVAARYGAG